MLKARNSLSKWVRALWIFYALNGIFVFGLTLWVMFQLLINPSARITEGLAAYELTPEFYAAFFLISLPIYFMTYFTVATLIFIRRPRDGFGLFAAIFLVNFGAATAYPTFAEFSHFYVNPPLWYAIPSLISILSSWTLLIPFLVLYPNGRFVPRGSWVIATAGVVLITLWSLFPEIFAGSNSLISIFGAVAAVGVTGASLYVQFWRYQHYFTTIERQQAKWFIFALAIFMVATFVYFYSTLHLTPIQTPAESIRSDLVATITGTLANGVIPIAVGFAILRYRLFDIDVIIRRTLQYAMFTGLLALIYFGNVLLFQILLENLTGQQSQIGIVISTLAIAALFNPLRLRVRNFIDRRFYRSRYNAEQALAGFTNTVRDEVDMEKLAGAMLHVVNETMHPEGTSLWLKK